VLLNKAPSLWSLKALMEHVNNGQSQSSADGKNWVPARPLGFYSMTERARLAWMVFTGKADALTWPQGQ
jgi:hypothetical protein